MNPGLQRCNLRVVQDTRHEHITLARCSNAKWMECLWQSERRKDPGEERSNAPSVPCSKTALALRPHQQQGLHLSERLPNALTPSIPRVAGLRLRLHHRRLRNDAGDERGSAHGRAIDIRGCAPGGGFLTSAAAMGVPGLSRGEAVRRSEMLSKSRTAT